MHGQAKQQRVGETSTLLYALICALRDPQQFRCAFCRESLSRSPSFHFSREFFFLVHVTPFAHTKMLLRRQRIRNLRSYRPFAGF